jgi:DNA-binding response OmpR family regulator
MLDPQRFSLQRINPNPRSIAEIRKVDPDIFVVDGSGSDEQVLVTCHNIRNYSGTPILVLAADYKPEFVEQVLDTGADEYLIRPVSESILAAYLNTLTRRARAEKDAALSFVNPNNERGHQGRLLTY